VLCDNRIRRVLAHERAYRVGVQFWTQRRRFACSTDTRPASISGPLAARGSLGQQTARPCLHGGTALAQLSFECFADASAQAGPSGREVVQRLERADLDLAAGAVDQIEEVGGDIPELVVGGFESWNHGNEAAQCVLAVGASCCAREQAGAMRLEPLGVVAGRLFDDFSGAAPDDGVVVIECGNEIADEARIGADGGERTCGRCGAPAIGLSEAIEERGAARAHSGSAGWRRGGVARLTNPAPLCSTTPLLPGPFDRRVVRRGLGAV